MATPMTSQPTEPHEWEFKASFRRRAFGWKSQFAVRRVKQAVREIEKVARKAPVVAAEGAVIFLERVSGAIEAVDGSSGLMGTAVNRAIGDLVPIIAGAAADAKTRAAWLDRLWEALEADEIPYIESLADRWGELCASKEVASGWAERLEERTRWVLQNKNVKEHRYFKGTTACLSSLYAAGKYAEIMELLGGASFWHYRRWGVKALAAMGRTDEALRLAESGGGSFLDDDDPGVVCEEILLAAGRTEEAYARGLRSTHAPTYLGTFRAIAKKYPQKAASQILADLVKGSKCEQGKWFAAAKEAGLYDEALALAQSTPCDPRTLTRAARDMAESRPSFAVAAGLLALRWIVQGYDYEITGGDVWQAYEMTMKAAEKDGTVTETRARIRSLVAGEAARGSRLITTVLGDELGLG